MAYTFLLMNPPFSKEAMATFYEALRVLGYGMTTVILVLFLFFIIIKLLIKLFPERD